jgi:hypothetical protein
MSKSITVKLNEKEVETAIKEWVKTNYQTKVKSIKMRTSVRGDYDKGNAEEYVQTVWCDCE